MTAGKYTPPAMAQRIIKHDGFFVKTFFASDTDLRPVAASCGYYYTRLPNFKEARHGPILLPLRDFGRGEGVGTVDGGGGLRPGRKVPN